MSSRISRSVFIAVVLLTLGLSAPPAWSKSVEDRLAEMEQAMAEIREIRTKLLAERRPDQPDDAGVTQMRGELEEFKHNLRNQEAQAELEKRVAALEQTRSAGPATPDPARSTRSLRPKRSLSPRKTSSTRPRICSKRGRWTPPARPLLIFRSSTPNPT